MQNNDLEMSGGDQMDPFHEHVFHYEIPLYDNEAVNPESGEPNYQPLGERCREMGFINAGQLQAALEFQKIHGGRLGDILVALGYVDQASIGKIFNAGSTYFPLGTILLREGVITNGQLNQALECQRKSGGLLGDIIITMRMAAPDRVYRCLAIQNQLGRVGTKFDPSEAGRLPYQIALKYQICIIHRQNNRFLLAVIRKLSEKELAIIESFVNMQVEQVLASRPEMDLYLNWTYGSYFTYESIYQLENEMPQNSARDTFSPSQKLTMFLLGAAFIIGCVQFPQWTLIITNALIQLIYFGIAVSKIYILMQGLKPNSQIQISDQELHALDEKELPIYTILVPIYHEAKVIQKLLSHLGKLDYPPAKLDVKLLLEQDDPETAQEFQIQDLPYYCTVTTVPHSLPKTKPKVCNHGLILARGKYLVIYDAEDRPEPDQLKKAFLAFKKLPEHYICVQSKLNYYNSNQNILTKWFTQEYSMWFEILLPGVVHLKMPVPLGGTSNHFKTEYLKKVGAWDPFNVTEDADLGIRIFKKGYCTTVMDSCTWEEANCRLGSWLRQRSRWIKGYMQTWLVHMRKPLTLRRELGRSGFWGFHAVILGSVFLPLVNPFLWFLMVYWYMTHAHWVRQLFRGPVYYTALALLFIGNFFFIYSNAIGIFRVVSNQELKKKEDGYPPLSYRLVKYALFSPIYWLLMSLAAYKALGQLLMKPFFWEKTPHGLSQKNF